MKNPRGNNDADTAREIAALLDQYAREGSAQAAALVDRAARLLGVKRPTPEPGDLSDKQKAALDIEVRHFDGKHDRWPSSASTRMIASRVGVSHAAIQKWRTENERYRAEFFKLVTRELLPKTRDGERESLLAYAQRNWDDEWCAEMRQEFSSPEEYADVMSGTTKPSPPPFIESVLRMSRQDQFTLLEKYAQDRPEDLRALGYDTPAQFADAMMKLEKWPIEWLGWCKPK